MKRNIWLLGLTVVACSTSTSPTAAVPSTTIPEYGAQPSPTPTNLSLTGRVVDDDNAVIAGATVTITTDTATGNAITDSQGSYRATTTFAQWTRGALAEKLGYESSYHDFLPRAGEASLNFRIRRSVSITAGALITLSVTPDDGDCAMPGIDLWPCRTVRVNATESGTLALNLVCPTALTCGAFLEVPGHGREVNSYAQLDTGSVQVAAGEEIVVQILFAADLHSPTITLKTSLH